MVSNINEIHFNEMIHIFSNGIKELLKNEIFRNIKNQERDYTNLPENFITLLKYKYGILFDNNNVIHIEDKEIMGIMVAEIMVYQLFIKKRLSFSFGSIPLEKLYDVLYKIIIKIYKKENENDNRCK